MHKIDFLILKKLLSKGISKWLVLNIMQRLSYIRCYCTVPYKNCNKCKTLIQTCLNCHPEMTNGMYPFPDEGLPKCWYCDAMYCAKCANDLKRSKSVRFICSKCYYMCGFCDGLVVHEHKECGFKVCEECYKYKKIEYNTSKNVTYEICYGCRKRL